MEYLNLLSCGFPTLAACLTAAFLFLLCVSMTGMIRRDRAGRELAAFFCLMSFYALLYGMSRSLHHPSSALLRYATPCLLMPMALHIIRWYCSFPAPAKRLHVRILTALLFIAAAGVCALYLPRLFSTPVLPLPRELSWELAAPDNVVIIAAALAGFLLITAGTALVRLVTAPEGARGTMGIVTLLFLLLFTLPVVFHYYAAAGNLGWNTAALAQAACCIAIPAAITIIHARAVTDRSPVALRLKTAFTAFLCIALLAIGHLFAENAEHAYDEHRMRDIVTSLAGAPPASVAYLASYATATDSFTLLRGELPGKDPAGFADLKEEFLNTALMARIADLPRDRFDERLAEILEKSHPGFSGYRIALERYSRLIHGSGRDTRESVLSYLQSLRRIVAFTRERLAAAPVQDFRENAIAILAAADPRIAPFLERAARILSPGAHSPRGLREELLRYFPQLVVNGERLVRMAPDGTRYIAYRIAGIAGGSVYEGGFRVDDYLAAMRRENAPLLAILLCIVAVTWLLQSIAFYTAVTSPAGELVTALDYLAKGHLDVTIPERGRDEIGLIARGVNAALRNSLEARKKIQSFSLELEKKIQLLEREIETQAEAVRTKSESITTLGLTLDRASRELDGVRRLMEQGGALIGALREKLAPGTGGFGHIRNWEIERLCRQAAPASSEAIDLYHRDGMLGGVSFFDVSGHDLSTGLTALLFRAILAEKFDALGSEKLHVVLEQANTELCAITGSWETSVTGHLLRFQDNRVEYINAGHPDILHYSPRTERAVSVKPKNHTPRSSLLGVSGVETGWEVLTFALEPGDCLLVYSDCCVTATGPAREPFGMQRLQHSFRNALVNFQPAVLERLHAEILGYAGRESLPDDVTLLLLRYRG